MFPPWMASDSSAVFVHCSRSVTTSTFTRSFGSASNAEVYSFRPAQPSNAEISPRQRGTGYLACVLASMSTGLPLLTTDSADLNASTSASLELTGPMPATPMLSAICA